MKGKIIALLMFCLLALSTPLMLVQFNAVPENMQTVTTDDITITTDPRTGLYVTFSKGGHTSLVRLWTIQDISTTGDVVNQIDITEDYLKSHVLTQHCTPTKIVLRYYFDEVTSSTNKPPQLEITVTTIDNGITINGELIDFAIQGKDHVVMLNYDRDNRGSTVELTSYAFALTFEFATTKTWFSAISNIFTELFAPKTETEESVTA